MPTAHIIFASGGGGSGAAPHPAITEINENELKNMLTLMFKAYEPEKDIKW